MGIVLAIIKAIPNLVWMTVILPVLAAFKARSLGDIKSTHRIWSQSVGVFLKVQYQKITNNPIAVQDVIFLCNHRTQADFFITDKVTDYKANMLSRKEVAYVFPMAAVVNPGSLWFFNRKNIQIDKFNQFIDDKFASSPRNSLIIYPEGHRMYRSTEVKTVKTGMIKYSYTRQKPIQIVMTFGNENVFNQKEIKIMFGQKVYFAFSEIIYPKDYPTQEAYVNHVTDRFKNFFLEIYALVEKKGQQSSEVLKDQ